MAKGELREAIYHIEDQVMVIDLGQSTTPLETGMEVIGRGYDPPSRTLVV